jgi:putative oxidoreductase
MTDVTRSPQPLSYADGVAAGTADFLLLLGRVLLAFIFIRSGFGKMFDIGGVMATYPARGLPPWLAYIAVPFEFFGGIALLLGIATRYVAIVLVVFMLVASFSSHAYWTIADAAARRNNDSQFWKNIAMLGGILYVFVFGAGRFSLDAWLGRRK